MSAVATLAVPTLALAAARLLGLKPPLEAAFGLALLVASWSIILDLYASWTHWDLAVHAALNGLVAAVGVHALTKVGALGTGFTRVSVVLVTTMLGVTCGVLWELYEWAANEYFGQALFVSYTDTLGDIAVGGLAAAIAGIASSSQRAVVSTPSSTPAIRRAQYIQIIHEDDAAGSRRRES